MKLRNGKTYELTENKNNRVELKEQINFSYRHLFNNKNSTKNNEKLSFVSHSSSLIEDIEKEQFIIPRTEKIINLYEIKINYILNLNNKKLKETYIRKYYEILSDLEKWLEELRPKSKNWFKANIEFTETQKLYFGDMNNKYDAYVVLLEQYKRFCNIDIVWYQLYSS